MPSLSSSHLLTKLRHAYDANPSRFRLAFIGLLAIVLLFTSVKYAAKIAERDEEGRLSRSAFLRWRLMIQDVFVGENIYVGTNEYPNPPIMAIILRPFAGLPPVIGAMTWFYAKVLMAVLAAVWVFRLAGGSARVPEFESGGEKTATNTPDPSHPHTLTPSHGLSDPAKAGALLIALPALMGDLTHNNINIFILFLVVACLELYRRGCDSASGLVLGLSIACKVTPLLFLAYFAWKRAYRVVAGCMLGLVLWLAVVPGAVFGWERNAELLGDWYALMIERPVLKGEITTEHANQAIVGWVYRLGTYSPSYIEYEQTPEGDIPVPGDYHNLFDMGRPAAWVVVKLLTAAFAIAVIVLCRTPRDERCGWRFAAECGLIALGMLLLSERTWKHHAVVLLIPAAALACAASRAVLSQRVRSFVVWAMVAAGCLMAMPGLFGRTVGDLAMVYGTHTFAFLLLTFATCAVLKGNGTRITQTSTRIHTDQTEEKNY